MANGVSVVEVVTDANGALVVDDDGKVNVNLSPAGMISVMLQNGGYITISRSENVTTIVVNDDDGTP